MREAAYLLCEVLKNAEQGARGVFNAYERILREMRTNQVNDALTRKVFKDIVKPLSEINGALEQVAGALEEVAGRKTPAG